MSVRDCKLFLSITAVVEAATGLCLLILPAVLFAVLLALDRAAVDTIFIGRLAGAALLAIGIASWMARTDTRTRAQLGLLTGILIYNVTASALLAYAGAVLKMVGALLWRAVAIHAILALWCFSCLQSDRHGDKIIY
jgi:hypothetical protein